MYFQGTRFAPFQVTKQCQKVNRSISSVTSTSFVSLLSTWFFQATG